MLRQTLLTGSGDFECAHMCVSAFKYFGDYSDNLILALERLFIFCLNLLWALLGLPYALMAYDEYL